MSTAALEIHIHLEDGRIVKFTQPDAALAKKILDHIQPNRFFLQSHLIIDGDYAITTFPCAGICRIDLIGDSLPVWPFHFVTDMQQIPEEEFQRRIQPEPRAGQTPPPPAVGSSIMAYGEFELVNGERLFTALEIQVEQRLPQDLGHVIQQIFSLGGMHARRQEGGIVLINPAKIVRLAIHPGPSTTPPGAWQAHRLAD